MRLGRFNLTRNGAFWYTRRSTLSFFWRCRWIWWPDFFRPDCNGGWGVWWGWFNIERLVFNPYDDWGEEQLERMAMTLECLADGVMREDEAAKAGGDDDHI